MEPYKIRFIKEYKELKERYEKLDARLEKHNKGELEFTPDSPIRLLVIQHEAMWVYMRALEMRAIHEDIDLKNEVE